MSVEGFIAANRERRSQLMKAIEELTRQNQGAEPKARTRRLRDEIKAIDKAIYKATGKGVGT